MADVGAMQERSPDVSYARSVQPRPYSRTLRIHFRVVFAMLNRTSSPCCFSQCWIEPIFVGRSSRSCVPTRNATGVSALPLPRCLALQPIVYRRGGLRTRHSYADAHGTRSCGVFKINLPSIDAKEGWLVTAEQSEPTATCSFHTGHSRNTCSLALST